MLSILIPVYNFKVVALVDALKKQCKKAGIMYEILVFDDGSKDKIKHENSLVGSYFGVNYTELSQNLGRARIRNWMAKSASYQNLLFLDCDTKIISKTFIKTYLKCIPDYEVISGGRTYSKKAPRARSKKLHWLYGKKRESKNAAYRQKKPIMYFHSNNFLVTRDIMMQCPFDETLVSYGYEDLLWAKNLYEKGIRVQHIDNQTEHLGLEKATDFLSKTKTSIDNLIELNRKGAQIETQLTKMATQLEGWGLKNKFLSFYKGRQDKIINNLMSEKPKMWNLLFFKLNHYYCVQQTP
jgi:glycosyltransferase involved in cell wall biosynthesis